VRQPRPQAMAMLAVELRASGSRTVEELLATCDAQKTTYGNLIEKIGEMEQARVLRFVDDEIGRLNGVVDKHLWAARAKEPTKHQEKLLPLTAEELQNGIADHLKELGARVCQEVQALTLDALRQLPAAFRSMPLQEALQLTPGAAWTRMPQLVVPPSTGAAATVSGTAALAANAGVSSPGTIAAALVQAFPTTAVVKQTTVESDTAPVDLFQARLEAADRLKQDIETSTAQLELLSSEQRQSLICQLQSNCQSIFRPISVANTGGA